MVARNEQCFAATSPNRTTPRLRRAAVIAAESVVSSCRGGESPSGDIIETYDTDAYGNTLIFTGRGADGVWFTDDDVQSSYGANEIIYCGYRFDAETQNYYVRNRYYSPVLGRWITRDPIGYAGGINVNEYVGGLAAAQTDPSGFGGRTLLPPGGVWTGGGTGIIYHHGVPFPNNNNTSNVNPRSHFQATGADILSPPDFHPLSASSPKCDTYPKCYSYVGANARCFCKCAGNSPWSQYVRACLVALYKQGASATLAHTSCYFWAEVKFGLFSAPVGTLGHCYRECSHLSVPLMPPPVEQPTMFFNMV